MAICAVCQDNIWWDLCNWTTYDGTVITNAAERDAYYAARYTSLQAWDDAEAKDIGSIERAEILGPWQTADGITKIGGWGNSYLYPLEIVTVGVARPGGYYPVGTQYRIESSDVDECVYIATSNVIVDGLSGYNSGSTYDIFKVYEYRSNVLFKNCVARGGQSGFYAPGISSNAGYYCYNCLAYDADENGIHLNGKIYLPAAAVNCTVFNCNKSGSAYRAGINIDNYGDLINCISIGNGGSNRDFSFDSNVTVANCISSDTSISGKPDCYTGKAAADVFTNAASGDFSLPSNSFARDKGQNYNNDIAKKDIAGVWRDATYDIGAWEYDTGYIPVETVDINITGIVSGSELAIYKTSDGSEIVAPITVTGSSYSTTHAYTSDLTVTVKIRNASGITKYLPYKAQAVITANGLNMIVAQVEDTIAS